MEIRHAGEAAGGPKIRVIDGKQPAARSIDSSVEGSQPRLFLGLSVGLWAVSVVITLLVLSMGAGTVTWQVLALAGVLHGAVAGVIVFVVRRIAGAVWRERQLARLNAALGQEIDERKRVEAALREANHAAERANRTKSEFLAGVSHELRTPLNAILGFSDILRRGLFGPLGSPRYEDYARDIHTSGRHLLDLINDILDIAKIEARKADLRESELDLDQLARSCVRMIAQRADDRGVRIGLDIAAEMPRLYADQRALKQILLNLLTNAVKFTPAGGRITLSGNLADDGGLQISVSDEGIGMSPEEIPRALEPFVQTASSRSTEEKGTGLGLTLVSRLIELHGGSLDLISAPGCGTTATICFPAERSRDPLMRAQLA